MYLGQLIEKAPSELLFDKPTHPYTQALLSAIPVPSLKKKRERIILKGEITSPINRSQAAVLLPAVRMRQTAAEARNRYSARSNRIISWHAI